MLLAGNRSFIFLNTVAPAQVTINRVLMDTLTENEKKALVNSDPSNMLEYNEVTQQVLGAVFCLSDQPIYCWCCGQADLAVGLQCPCFV